MKRLFLLISLIFLPVITTFATNSVSISSSPSSVTASEEFIVNFNAASLDPNSTYNVKALGGDSFTQVDTWNSSWLQQNSSWSSMPEFSSTSEGTAAASVKARFELNTTAGSKELKVRIRKTGVDPYSDSAIVNLSVIAVTPTPTITPTPAPTSSPTNTPAPTSGPTSTPKPASPTPTKKPTSIPTSKPTEFEEESNDSENTLLENQLLGASTSAENIENPTPAPTNKPKTKSAVHPVPIIIISLGILLMLGGSTPLLFKYLKTKRKI